MGTGLCRFIYLHSGWCIAGVAILKNTGYTGLSPVYGRQDKLETSVAFRPIYRYGVYLCIVGACIGAIQSHDQYRPRFHHRTHGLYLLLFQQS